MLSRKDVKLGLAIGGILLAVVVVYLLSSPGGKPGVELAKTDSTVNGDAHQPAAGPAGDVSAPKAGPGAGTMSETQGGGAAPAPDMASAGSLAVAAAGSASTSAAPANDPWDSALRYGKLPAMMSSTPTTPGANTATGGSIDGAAQPTVAAGTAALAANGTTDGGKAIVSAAGPTTEPAVQPSSDAVASAARVHVVKPGETLSTIAAAAWGRSSLYDNLIRANPGIDPRHLHVGMKINIPVLDTARPTRTESANGAAAQSSMGDGEPAGGAAGGGVITPSKYVAGAPARAELGAEQSGHSGIATDGKTYTVVASDSLFRISKRLYGNTRLANQIYALNKDVIGADMAKLKVGMVLKLPETPTNLAKAG